mmetsp:Transcript_29867/g.45175  ORF Transcript_29867/g.45175 Transcript_29867/m.45175 type:complete len:176 (+) Transcript_29867:118-645(+)
MMSSTAAHLFTPKQPQPSSTQQLLLLAFSCPPPPRPRRRTAATATAADDDFSSISTRITTSSSSRNLPPTIPILNNNLHQQQFLPSFHNHHHIPTITLKPRPSSLHLKKKANRSPIKVCRAVKHSVRSDMKMKKSTLRNLNPNSYNQLGGRNRNQQMIGSGSSRHRSASFSSPAA